MQAVPGTALESRACDTMYGLYIGLLLSMLSKGAIRCVVEQWW